MGKQFQVNKVNVDYRKFQLTALTMDFVVETPADVLNEGVAVTLTASGTIRPSVGGEISIGYVTTKYDPDQSLPPAENRATIQMVGLDVVNGVADGIVATGALVSAEGLNGTDPNYSNYLVAGTGTYANGIAIKGAGDGEQVDVLLLHSPVYVP